MAIIKVSTSLFSAIKTIERAVNKAKRGDVIQVASGLYKESIQLHETVSVVGRNRKDTIVEGMLVVPRNRTATFEQLTIVPTAQIYIEGKAVFKNCHFQGRSTSVILSVSNGEVELEDCTIEQAKDVGLALFEGSEAMVKKCLFKNNGKSHALLEGSHLTIEDSELTDAVHGLWLKNSATAKSTGNHIHHHSGTQIVVQDESAWIDSSSIISDGEGNGIYATGQSTVTLIGSHLHHQQLPQLWMQKSYLTAKHCTIEHGEESGIMLREHASAEIENCVISHHKLANVQATMESRLTIEDSQLHSCEGVGVQVREKSIANFVDTTFAEHVLSQLFVTEKSVTSLKRCTFQDGKQVGILLEKGGSCTIVDSSLVNHHNTAITVIDAELTVLDCEVAFNEGNGILATTKAVVNVEGSRMYANEMPHIAGKEGASITIQQSELYEGKSLYVIDNSQVSVSDCKINNSDGVQIEINNRTEAKLRRCIISNGKTNGFKILRGSRLHLEDCQISNHALPQIVLNDSTLVMKNSELLEGERNGLIVENNSKVSIHDSFITKHAFPQIWIDLASSVELTYTQITEGAESDIYVQNQSSLHATGCIIRNDRFQYNVQAVNYSNITLEDTLVENVTGKMFYSENNSRITHSLDEVSD
ncbi:MAG: pectinesterase family protein [Lysinibacillus sp.]